MATPAVKHSALVRSGRRDDDEFEVMIRPLIKPAVRIAFDMLHNRQEAEDATQEAVLRAWQKRPQLRDAAKARAWFFAIVVNQCRNMRRSRWFSVLRTGEPLTASSGQRISTTADEAIDLRRALNRLPTLDRAALFLVFYLDLPMDEVAAVLGVSMDAAKKRVHRACRKVRPQLEEVRL